MLPSSLKNLPFRQTVVLLLCLIGVTQSARAAEMLGGYRPVEFLRNLRLQNLNAAFPKGDVTLGGIPFTIPPNGNNAWSAADEGGPNPRCLDIQVDVYGVSEAHTLINTAWGRPGPNRYASLEFFGDGGARYKKTLAGNSDIRDYFTGSWTTQINGTTSTSVFQITNEAGAGTGEYHLDKQEILLPEAFRGQTLTSIRACDEGGENFQRIILSGVTVRVQPTGSLLTGRITANGVSVPNAAVTAAQDGVVRTARTEPLVYTNPVLPNDAPDPTVIYVKPYYYLYTTISSNGLIPIYRSTNLKSWSFVRQAFTQRPTWMKDQDFWAPDIHYFAGKYWLYYSTNAKNIGFATAPAPAGPWTDSGEAVTANSLDPNVFVEGNRRYLVHGSFYSGPPIRIQELSADGKSLIGPSSDIGGGEGGFLQKRGGYYYLFQSYSPCCDDYSDYHVTASRSKSLFGPYLDKSGRANGEGETILIRTAAWGGPGHHTILRDAMGQEWVIYHAMKDGLISRYGRWALMDPLRWSPDGWPVIGNGTPTAKSNQGHYELPLPSGGVTALSVRAYGYEPLEGEINVTENTAETADFALTASPLFPLSAYDEFDGTALDSGKWEAVSEEGAGEGTTSVSGGELELHGPGAGHRWGVRTTGTFAAEDSVAEAVIDFVEGFGAPGANAIMQLYTGDGGFNGFIEFGAEGKDALGLPLLHIWGLGGGDPSFSAPTDFPLRLTVHRRENNYDFYVNGQWLHSAESASLSGDHRVFLYGYGSSIARFSSFLANAVPPPIVCGDADLNGQVNATDAVKALRSIVGLEALSTEQLKAADTDHDGQVNAADAVKILRMTVGLDSPCPP